MYEQFDTSGYFQYRQNQPVQDGALHKKKFDCTCDNLKKGDVGTKFYYVMYCVIYTVVDDRKCMRSR